MGGWNALHQLSEVLRGDPSLAGQQCCFIMMMFLAASREPSPSTGKTRENRRRSTQQGSVFNKFQPKKIHEKKFVQKAVSVLAQSSPNVRQLYALFSFVFLCSAVDVLGLLEPHSHSWSGAFITECRMARDDFLSQRLKHNARYTIYI